MELLFKKVKTAFPKSIVQTEKNYVSFTFGGGLYYQLRVQKDKVRMMATNYPNKAKLGECIKIIRKNKIEGQEINGKEILFEIGIKNPEIFTLRLEIPYTGTKLENDKFNAGIVDSCAKFHVALLPLVNAFVKQPVGDLYSLMGGKPVKASAKVEQVKAAPKKVSAKPKVTLQQQLADALIEHFPDATVKKIDKDNYLDIHIPVISEKIGTHFTFTTLKNGIKLSVYSKDDVLCKKFLNNSSELEPTTRGVRLKDNPSYETIEEAIDGALLFIGEMKESKQKRIAKKAVPKKAATKKAAKKKVSRVIDEEEEESNNISFESLKPNSIKILKVGDKINGSMFKNTAKLNFWLGDHKEIYIKDILFSEENEKHLVLTADKNGKAIDYWDMEAVNTQLSDNFKFEYNDDGAAQEQKEYKDDNDDEFENSYTFSVVIKDEEEEEVDDKKVVKNLTYFDIKEDSVINYISDKIKNQKYLTNLLYINKELKSNGYETDNHQAYFFDSRVLISDRELEGFLVVNMDGFYSNCMNEEEMQMIFSWSGVDDLEYEEDGDDCSIDIVTDQGRLTIKKEESHSLKILYTFYKHVWKEINDNYKDEPIIVWNNVWKMGIKEIGFSEFIDYYMFDVSQEDEEITEFKPTKKAEPKKQIEVIDEVNEVDEKPSEEDFFVGKIYEKQYIHFLEIAGKTGILINEIKIEPTPKERDELWEIIRVFSDRIYQIDDEKSPDKKELNTLCFYAIVGLHWCDIMINDKRFSFTNGRFRRDTLALALCFYARIDRDYDYYDHVKMKFIMPHMHFSVLLWTVNSIVNIGQDNLLAMFSPEQALKAQQLFTEMDKKNQASGVFGIIDPSKMPDNHPLKAIWSEIFSLFRNVRIPFQFIRNYISLELPKRSFIQNLLSKEGKNRPGLNVTLLDIDKQKNIAFLDRQIEHKQFPADWVFVHDIAFVSIYFATTTDADLDNEEMNIILTQIGEWINEADQKKLKKLSTDAFNKAKEQFRRDKSNERFSFALENIRRQILVQKKYDIDETKKQLQIILNDLLAIAEADNDVKSEEVDLVVAIRDNWGIVWDSGEEQNDNVIEVDEDEQDVEELEQDDFDIDEKISEFYCDNVWYREFYDLDKKPFPDVIRNQKDLDVLFRKFTPEEVDLIVKKIKKTKSYILLPFIKEILGRDMDLSSYKPPFWFIPIVAYGNNISSILYFNQDGIYNTFKNSSSLSMAIKVDVWKSISVEQGYNGLFDDDSDDENLSSLKIDWYNPNSGNSGATNVVEFHGEEYGASLKILMAIWNYAWKDVVDRSKGTSQFLLGPPPFLESFDNWDELIEWAKKK